MIHKTSMYSLHIYDEDKYQYAGVEDPVISNLLVEDNIINNSRTRAGIIISAGESTSKAIEINGYSKYIEINGFKITDSSTLLDSDRFEDYSQGGDGIKISNFYD